MALRQRLKEPGQFIGLQESVAAHDTPDHLDASRRVRFEMTPCDRLAENARSQRADLDGWRPGPCRLGGWVPGRVTCGNRGQCLWWWHGGAMLGFGVERPDAFAAGEIGEGKDTNARGG